MNTKAVKPVLLALAGGAIGGGVVALGAQAGLVKPTTLRGAGLMTGSVLAVLGGAALLFGKGELVQDLGMGALGAGGFALLASAFAPGTTPPATSQTTSGNLAWGQRGHYAGSQMHSQSSHVGALPSGGYGPPPWRRAVGPSAAMRAAASRINW